MHESRPFLTQFRMTLCPLRFFSATGYVQVNNLIRTFYVNAKTKNKYYLRHMGLCSFCLKGQKFWLAPGSQNLRTYSTLPNRSNVTFIN